MRLLLAIFIGKIISKLTRLLRIGGGSAAPGLYALKIEPRLVEKLIQKIPKNIIITGTNGKTTTARMVAHFAKEAGLKVIRNHTGSNLERGVTSTLIQGVNLSHPGGVFNRHLGIWELDEAAFNTVAPKIKPEIVVFLNVFRDQLDRYGEVDSVVKKWCQTLTTLTPQTMVIVNGDDANTKSLRGCFKGKVQMFGVKGYKIVGESIEQRSEQENYDFEAKNVKLNGLKGSTFILQTTYYKLQTTLPLPGIYHIYDFLAAFAAGISLGFDPNDMGSSIANFSPAFGRVEKIPQGYIFLIKNPAGATQVFETITPFINSEDRLLLALNDNLADGTDVSWIWDADFELFQNPSRALRLRSGSRDLNIYVSGTRAYDMANRLKYAGFDSKLINFEPNLKKAIRQAREGLKGSLYILPTYTAMLELQSILAKSGMKRPYWEEDE